MVWSRRSAICMTVAAGLLYPGLLSAQEMPSEYKTVLAALGKGGDFRDAARVRRLDCADQRSRRRRGAAGPAVKLAQGVRSAVDLPGKAAPSQH